MVAFWQVPVRGMACRLQLCRGIAAASCPIVALWFVCGAGAAPLRSCPRAASRAAAAARACRAVSALRGGPLLLWTRCCHRSRCWTGATRCVPTCGRVGRPRLPPVGRPPPVPCSPCLCPWGVPWSPDSDCLPVSPRMRGATRHTFFTPPAWVSYHDPGGSQGCSHCCAVMLLVPQVCSHVVVAHS